MAGRHIRLEIDAVLAVDAPDLIRTEAALEARDVVDADRVPG
jgi:hypothetical protein